MGFLLDTNVLSDYLRGHPRVLQRAAQYGGRLFISTVTLGEISVWPRLRGARITRDELDLLLGGLHVIPLDEAIALRFAEVAAALRNAGTPKPTPDLLIAATALHHGLTMVTANRRDFDPVPGLPVEDWTAA
ncbi:type II toxin-antitoxin system VapC family toxin [Alienimonas chondri]|uniref:Ribonuclease VapC n=1 Tax=Alienimonas chondri TaxID=2681879 RepID=A0ABX1VHG2_9PLAN|nr:type II toxin-antitoxin system VapC family toxin [Alienimonas chondri]NNJ27568.1 Ribonuclease VapC1 [Alienimonas chondri]